MSDIAYGLKALTGAIKIAKNLKDFQKQLNDSTFQLQISELYDNLAETKMGMAELKDLLRTKDDEIRSLKESLSIKQNVVYNDTYYQVKNDKGNLEGQYCKVCYDDKKKLMRLTKVIEDPGWWKCQRCLETFFEEGC